MNTKIREIWPDNIKLFACVLVVLGHFFQSMTKAGILPADGWHVWMERAVYIFHVQLFFICSGYLYQKYTSMQSIADWGKNVVKKAIVLGLPYFVFSILSWGLKYIFSAYANSQAGSLLQALFVNPVAPYWYMYILFFVFFFIPVVRTKKAYFLLLVISLILKGAYIKEIDFSLYVIESICENSVWFVLGMGLAFINFKKIVSGVESLIFGAVLGVCFLAGSIYVYKCWIWERLVLFLLGLIACASALLVIGHVFYDNHQNKILGFLAKYTMPIFLMHTIFAAGIRIVLLHIGVRTLALHFVFGVIGGFMGPVITAMILERIPYGDFVLYPGKYIRK